MQARGAVAVTLDTPYLVQLLEPRYIQRIS